MFMKQGGYPREYCAFRDHVMFHDEDLGRRWNERHADTG
jgi:hypothetical protein